MEQITQWYDAACAPWIYDRPDGALAWARWGHEYPDIPVIFSAAYIGLVFFVPKWMESRPAFNLKPLFIWWNFALAVFSVLGFIYTGPVFLKHLWTSGFYTSVCGDPVTNFGSTAAAPWVIYFILSKIPELMDTVFLVLQKKPVIFLHWFHHLTVMLYCWHALVTANSSGWWFAVMNYFVHAIMYSYYFMMALSERTRKMVKPFAQFITTIQILQMVVGLIVTYAGRLYKHQVGDACMLDYANNRFGLAMYTFYFILFCLFFRKIYLTPRQRGERPAVTPKAASLAPPEKRK